MFVLVNKNLSGSCNHPSDHSINPAEWFTISIMRMIEYSQYHVLCMLKVDILSTISTTLFLKMSKRSQNILEIPSDHPLLLCSIESMANYTCKHPNTKVDSMDSSLKLVYWSGYTHNHSWLTPYQQGYLILSELKFQDYKNVLLERLTMCTNRDILLLIIKQNIIKHYYYYYLILFKCNKCVITNVVIKMIY